jgi:organic radical activating enzyme
MTYAIAEIFKTLQGEGLNAGRSAVFVRFAACNLWSGKEQDRVRDSERHGALCPRFCDTDFNVRHRMEHDQLLEAIEALAPSALVVFTGGEPLLQLKPELVRDVNSMGVDTAIETNGTVALSDELGAELTHICVSPKRVDSEIVLREGYELKIVFPRYRPEDYVRLADGFTHLLLSPEAELIQLGRSATRARVERMAADWCMGNPPWRLSLQLHKHLELP